MTLANFNSRSEISSIMPFCQTNFLNPQIFLAIIILISLNVMTSVCHELCLVPNLVQFNRYSSIFQLDLIYFKGDLLSTRIQYRKQLNHARPLHTISKTRKKLFCTFFKYLFSSLMSLIGLFWKVISLEFPRYLTHAHIHNVYTEPISFRAAVKLLSYAFIKSSLFLILLFLSWFFEKCGIIFNETELRMR